AGPPGSRGSDHRLPPAARDLQMEPDRASAVQRDLDELARPSAGKPRGDRRADRGDHDPHGPAGPRRAGPRPLPPWGQGTRQEAGDGAAAAARIPRGVELHRSSESSGSTTDGKVTERGPLTAIAPPTS